MGLLDVARAPHRANAAPAAAADRLDHHARAVLSGEEAHRMGAAGRERHAAARGERPRLGLVAEKGELLGGRANPSQTRRLAGFGEFRVFRSENLSRGGWRRIRFAGRRR